MRNGRGCPRSQRRGGGKRLLASLSFKRSQATGLEMEVGLAMGS